MRTALIAVLALAAWLATTQAQDCKLQRMTSVDANVDGSDHLYIPADVGRPTKLMVDTGGAWSLMKADLADELKLARHISHNIEFVDASGARLNQYVQVPNLKLGSLTFNGKTDFLVMPGYKGRLADFGGTIGLNIIARFDVELDSAAKKVNLFRPHDCANMGAYWANEYVEWPIINASGLPETKVDIEGEEIRALIDTGATRTFMSLSVARKFDLEPTSPGVVAGRDLTLPSGRVSKTYTYTFKTLTVSGFRFENVEVVLNENDEGLTLGMSELKHLHLYFSFKEKMIYATTADARR